MKDAEAKREEEEADGLSGYEYHYRIAVEPFGTFTSGGQKEQHK